MEREKLENLRQNYEFTGLSEEMINEDPIKQFEHWFDDALHANLNEPNTMTLATSGIDGKPSARIVLLKGFDQNGFVFYTNYLSNKGHDMAQNPQVALLFFWVELARQVRIEGIADKISVERSETYFHSRPRGSQIAALASPQSQLITNRMQLENMCESLRQEYEAKAIPKPEHWGGYLVKPQQIEFWQGRQNRLHDRIIYQKQEDNKWITSRVAP